MLIINPRRLVHTTYTKMDIATSLDKLSSKLEHLENKDLLRLLVSLENMISKTKDILTKSTSQHPPSMPQPCRSTYNAATPLTATTSQKIDNLLSYSSQPLDVSLVTRVHEHVKDLTYHPNPDNPKSPEIFLYGDQPYQYNQQSREIAPKPILTSLVMSELLCAVNVALHTEYNSMLINKYNNFHSCLGPHKDDEPSLEPLSPISTLSLGATRRFQISTGRDNNSIVHTVHLKSGSLCTMYPGFQEAFYHQIAPGRKSIAKEKGERYSITFRCVTASKPSILVEEEKEEELWSEIEHITNDSPDTLVFGSSLTKDLDETLLSKHQKKFKVYSNPGACVKDIAKDVQRVKDEEGEKGNLKFSGVTSVFLVCGGNDIQNLRRDSDIDYVCKDYEHLVGLVRDIFPAARVNVVSLIPRATTYKTHVDNMHEFNEWLYNFCHKNSLRFVNIYTHFIIKRPDIWCLNDKLFTSKKIHFSITGNSVLAKVLIGVANSPRM